MVRAGYPVQFMTCRCLETIIFCVQSNKGETLHTFFIFVILLHILEAINKKETKFFPSFTFFIFVGIRVWAHIPNARTLLYFTNKFFSVKHPCTTQPRLPSIAVQPALQTAAGNPPQTRSSDIARRVARGGFKWGQASYPPRPGG